MSARCVGACLTVVLLLAGSGLTGEPDPPKAPEVPKTPDPETEAYLAKVEEKLSTINTLSANFTQTKKLNLLEHEIVIKGTLYLDKEGRLAWHVTSPIKYSCVIDKEKIRQWDEDSNTVTEFTVEDHPGLEIMFKYLRSWFAGQLSSLRSEFACVAKPAEHRLDFTPREESKARGFVKSITLNLREDLTYLEKVVIVEVKGDKTTIAFENTKLNVTIPPGKWNVIQD